MRDNCIFDESFLCDGCLQCADNNVIWDKECIIDPLDSCNKCLMCTNK